MEVVFWGMEENPPRDPQVELAIEQSKLERDRISRRVGRRKCCQCNGNGSCVRCECAASRKRCTNCLPLKRNRCGNPPNADESSLPVSADTEIDRTQELFPPSTSDVVNAEEINRPLGTQELFPLRLLTPWMLKKTFLARIVVSSLTLRWWVSRHMIIRAWWWIVLRRNNMHKNHKIPYLVR